MARDKELERAFKRLRRRRLGFNLPTALLLIVAGLLIWNRWREDPEPPPPDALAPGVYRVKRVVDGDTFQLANGARVRMLGVDTPETVKPNTPVEPWGPEASARTKALIEGRDVRLEFDKERTDRYGRFLAYVWYHDDRSGEESLLNEELLREGLGRFGDYRYSETMKRRFRRAQQEAQDSALGIWSDRKAA